MVGVASTQGNVIFTIQVVLLCSFLMYFVYDNEMEWNDDDSFLFAFFYFLDDNGYVNIIPTEDESTHALSLDRDRVSELTRPQ